jgi:hypothetical protein
MKRTLIHLSVLAVALTIIGVSLAQAQTDQTVRANIPFDFHAGKQLMPAGTYNVELDLEGNVVRIVDISSQRSIFLMGSPAGDNDNGESADRNESALVFDRSGGSYFLRELKGNVLDVSFAATKAEGPLEAVVVPLTPIP